MAQSSWDSVNLLTNTLIGGSDAVNNTPFPPCSLSLPLCHRPPSVCSYSSLPDPESQWVTKHKEIKTKLTTKI